MIWLSIWQKQCIHWVGVLVQKKNIDVSMNKDVLYIKRVTNIIHTMAVSNKYKSNGNNVKENNDTICRYIKRPRIGG